MKKLSKFVKQNSSEYFMESNFVPKNKWQRPDLNQRPRAYESPALPLSYAANRQNIAYTHLAVNFTG